MSGVPLLDAEQYDQIYSWVKEFGAWGEHPQYPVTDWKIEVAADDTRLAYWHWVWIQCGGHD